MDDKVGDKVVRGGDGKEAMRLIKRDEMIDFDGEVCVRK